jgi:hypothetical protein
MAAEVHMGDDILARCMSGGQWVGCAAGDLQFEWLERELINHGARAEVVDGERDLEAVARTWAAGNGGAVRARSAPGPATAIGTAALPSAPSSSRAATRMVYSAYSPATG